MKPLPRRVYNRMLLRSLSVQGSWNYETLIGTGFVYTLLPALRTIYGTREGRLEAAVARHIELFNSHPYLATVAVGAVSRLEAEGVEPAVVQRFKTALRGALGAMGDRLVWSAWRPMSILLALLLILMGTAWWVAVVTFLAVYNAMHLTIRALGLRLGTQAGLEVGRKLRDIPLQPIIERSSQLACFLVGASVMLAAVPLARDPIALVPTAVAIGAGFALGARARTALIGSLVIVTVLALFIGLTGYGTE